MQDFILLVLGKRYWYLVFSVPGSDEVRELKNAVLWLDAWSALSRIERRDSFYP